MNIVAHNVASKLFVGFVAVAMFFMLVAPAKAATAEELQAQINALLAQVAALQGQVGQGGASSASAACPFTWTRSLNVGATGADVMKLQQFLNADAETRVAASGVGSAGSETEYFGPATAAAVSKFQVKYRSEVLSPAGLVNPTGYFGPATMAKANLLCKSAPVTGGDDTAGDDTTDDSSDDTTSGDLSGEASLKSISIEDGEDTDLEEGQTEESVQEFVVEFEDGDAMITRLDVEFDTDATDDLWDVLGEVTLYVDGDEVASIDASDEDNWRDDEATLRFSGLDVVAMEDEEATISLGVEVQDNLDDNSQIVAVDVTGMRYVDGDDVTSTETEGDLDEAGADSAGSFNISAAGSEDELIVKSNSSDPDATTLIVDDETTKSDWYTVLMFDLDTDDSINDIELNTVAVQLLTGTEDVDNVVQDAELVIDGVTYDDWDWSTTTGSTAMDMEFDIDGDAVIDAGDRVEAELKLRFFGTDNGNQYAEGETIQGKASTTLFRAEGVEDVDATGAATGEVHTLRSAGLVADASSVVTDESTSGDNDTTGTFKITFEVTALEGDFYVEEGSVLYTVEGPALAAWDDNAVLTSTGEEESAGVFTVLEGETETFTLTVTLTTDTAGLYRVTADSIEFTTNPDGVTGVDVLDLDPSTDYRTDYEQVNATV